VERELSAAILRSARVGLIDGGVFEVAAGLERVDVARDDVGQSVPVFRRVTARVGRNETVLEVPERVIGGERFGIGNVECGPADPLELQRRNERVGVDDAAPRAALTTTAFGGSVASSSSPTSPAGQVVERAREDDIVAPGERLVDIVLVEPQHLVGRAAFEGV